MYRTDFGINSQKSIYPILSIDGGGIRGIIPARVLVEIEDITKKPISSLFRLTGGTSTGGLLTLGLTATEDGKNPKFKAQDILDIYTQRYTEIFVKNINYNPNSNFYQKIIEPLYQAPTALFQEIFGDLSFDSALTDVVITANDVGSIFNKVGSVGLNAITGFTSLIKGAITGIPSVIYSHDSMPKKIHLFTKRGLQTLSYETYKMQQAFSPLNKTNSIKAYRINIQKEGDFYMRGVAQITSAAPTYFPPLLTFLDGGVLQNNPAIPCIVEALEKNQLPKDLFLVSLGTGLNSEKALVKDFATLGASMWFQTVQNDEAEEEILKEILLSQSYLRLQHNFIGQEAPSLDAHTPEVIHALQEAGNQLVEDKADDLLALCRILDPNII